MKVYHITPYYRRILQKGLKTRRGRGTSDIKARYLMDRTYFFTSLEGVTDLGMEYAVDTVEKVGQPELSSWGILEIDLPKGYKLKPDPEFEDCTLEQGPSVYGKGYIPPDRIRLLKVIDLSVWLTPDRVDVPTSPSRPYGGFRLVGYDNPKWLLFQDQEEEKQKSWLGIQRRLVESERKSKSYKKYGNVREEEARLKEFEEISLASQLIK